MSSLDLSMEVLDPIEAPISDFWVGLAAGAAFGTGIIVGAVLVLT